MQTTKEQRNFTQCPCGLQGFAVEVDTGRQTFRHRTFDIASKDDKSIVHRAVFQWKEEDRRSTGECFGQV